MISNQIVFGLIIHSQILNNRSVSSYFDVYGRVYVNVILKISTLSVYADWTLVVFVVKMWSYSFYRCAHCHVFAVVSPSLPHCCTLRAMASFLMTHRLVQYLLQSYEHTHGLYRGGRILYKLFTISVVGSGNIILYLTAIKRATTCFYVHGFDVNVNLKKTKTKYTVPQGEFVNRAKYVRFLLPANRCCPVVST